MLDALDEGMICHTLRSRFVQDAFYTAVGTILVAINPFQYLPIYGPDRMLDYHRPGNRKLPPHVFSVAAAAHKDMALSGIDQAHMAHAQSGAHAPCKRARAVQACTRRARAVHTPFTCHSHAIHMPSTQ